jgi:anaphase-promoting complex subunit 6
MKLYIPLQALVLSPLNPSTYSAMGFVHAIVGNTDEAVDAFHKALGIRRDDTFSTTMLSYVIEQLAEDTPPFQGIAIFILLALNVYN